MLLSGISRILSSYQSYRKSFDLAELCKDFESCIFVYWYLVLVFTRFFVSPDNIPNSNCYLKMRGMLVQFLIKMWGHKLSVLKNSHRLLEKIFDKLRHSLGWMKPVYGIWSMSLKMYEYVLIHLSVPIKGKRYFTRRAKRTKFFVAGAVKRIVFCRLSGERIIIQVSRSAYLKTKK